MKKSNKLLLGGFLTVILLIAGIHIALFAKYKNGNYTISKAIEETSNERMQSFPIVSHVVIRNVRTAGVIFSDMAAVERNKEDLIKYEQQGDSLIITGHYYNDDQPDGRSQVNFTLPHNVTLHAVNSYLNFVKAENTEGINPVLYLQNSYATFLPRNEPYLLGSVKVVASDSSYVSFQGNTQINQLDVQLSNSTLEYNRGEVGQLNILTDSVSRLSLQTKHLLKAKITTTANNP